MSYRLHSQIGGWGAVENPLEDGEYIPVDDGDIVVGDEELARALESEYDALILVDEPDEETDEEEDDTSEEEAESDELSGREPPVDPYDLSVSELHEWAANTDDPEQIDIVLEYERVGKDRSSAIERLEQRRGAIND